MIQTPPEVIEKSQQLCCRVTGLGSHSDPNPRVSKNNSKTSSPTSCALHHQQQTTANTTIQEYAPVPLLEGPQHSVIFVWSITSAPSTGPENTARPAWDPLHSILDIPTFLLTALLPSKCSDPSPGRQARAQL